MNPAGFFFQESHLQLYKLAISPMRFSGISFRNINTTPAYEIKTKLCMDIFSKKQLKSQCIFIDIFIDLFRTLNTSNTLCVYFSTYVYSDFKGSYVVKSFDDNRKLMQCKKQQKKCLTGNSTLVQNFKLYFKQLLCFYSSEKRGLCLMKYSPVMHYNFWIFNLIIPL